MSQLRRILLLACLLATAGRSTAQGTDMGAVATVLEAHPRSAPGPALERALVALGPGAIGPLFSASRTGLAPPYAEPLNAPQRLALEAALLALPEDDLVNHFRGLAVVETEPADREHALRLFGRFALGRHLTLLGRLASPAGTEERLDRTVARAFEAAFARVVEREPKALGRVPQLYAAAGSGLATSLLRALGDDGRPAAVQALGSSLGVHRALDMFLLSHLRRSVARASRVESSAGLRAELLRMLREDDVERSAAAAASLGALQDDEVVADLVELLNRPEERQRQAASDALGRITGFGFGSDHVAWRRWFEVEERWWHERSAVVLDSLERAQGQAFTRAVVEALGRRTHRDRIAQALALRLRDRDPAQVEAACQALAQVRSHAALADLVDCLRSPVGQVRQAARASLTAILGFDEPPPGATWADYL